MTRQEFIEKFRRRWVSLCHDGIPALQRKRPPTTCDGDKWAEAQWDKFFEAEDIAVALLGQIFDQCVDRPIEKTNGTTTTNHTPKIPAAQGVAPKRG